MFDIAVAAIGNDSTKKKVMRMIGAALAGFATAAAAGSLPGLLIVVAGLWYCNLALVLLGVLLLLIGIAVGVAICLYRAISKGIRVNDFGLCPGKTQSGYSTPGLSDWLADKIDDIAGRDPKKGSAADLRRSVVGGSRRRAQDHLKDDDDQSHAAPALQPAVQ
jgi:hypothetical protein